MVIDIFRANKINSYQCNDNKNKALLYRINVLIENIQNIKYYENWIFDSIHGKKKREFTRFHYSSDVFPNYFFITPHINILVG